MMLNPSSDFFDNDDDSSSDKEVVEEDDGDENYENDDEEGDYDNDESYDDNEDTTEKLKVKNTDDKEDEDDDGGDDDRDFMLNEEGSGGGYKYAYSKHRNNLYKNRLRLDFIEKYRRKYQKPQKLPDDDDGDNEDDDDDDDDDDDITSRREGSASGGRDRNGGSGGNFDASDDEDDDDDFFASKRKSNSKYFRKNTNDAIKIISTPHGKVGIVYQQTDTTSEKKSKDSDENGQGENRRLQQKITPVLTADGKVALLYRGASENTKYEPILNLTHTFNYDNKTSAVNNAKSSNDKDDNDIKDNGSLSSSTTEEIFKPNRVLQGEHTFSSSSSSSSLSSTLDPSNDDDDDDSPGASTGSEQQQQQENSILPNINRPLSEVLGIKKNQFKQFRIKDAPTTVTTLEFEKSTSVDLKKLSKSSNYDYDFGLDATEYDDRNIRYNQLDANNNNNPPKVSESTNPTISTSEILSKTEVVNLAIIPHFDEDFERQQHYRDQPTRRHHRQRHRYRHINEDLSGVHCIMQAMMGIAAISTVFGMLGAFFKQRILDQIRMMHW